MANQNTQGNTTRIDRLANFLIYNSRNKERSFYFRYGFPVVLILLVTFVKIIFREPLGYYSPYMLYFGIVSLSGVVGGIGPGTFSALFSAVVAHHYFISTGGSLVFTTDELLKTALFLFDCSILIILSNGIRSAYKQVQQNQLLFRCLIEKGTEGIAMMNNEGKTIYSSPSVEKITGYTADEFMEMPLQSLVHEDDQPQFRKQIEELMNFPCESASFIHRLHHKQGNWVWVENTITNMLNENAVCALIVNFYNITERIKLEQQREDFVGIASHELKTPVTSIKLLVQLLKKQFNDKGNERTSASLNKIENQVNRMTGLLNDLFDVTLLKQGQLNFKLEKICLNQLIEDVINNFDMPNNHHQIIFNPGDIAVFNGDKERLSQVVYNLLTNAVKYSPNGDKVIITSCQKEKNIKVTVQDFGIGIKNEELENVFGRFYRAKDDKTQMQAGLGLGLYIAAGIIKRQGGEIGVESKFGEGSTFWFTLPAA